MTLHLARTQSAATPTAASAKGAAKGPGWQNIPHIQQLHPDGANEGYVNGATFCGPAVVAMLARGANRQRGLSDARLIQELGQGLMSQNGASPQDLVTMLERVNLPLGGPALASSYSDAELQQHLRQGHKLIAQVESVNAQTGERSAHYILVRGMTPEGNYRISNPLAGQPQVVSPQRLRGLVGRAPPDGGMLIPVASPRYVSEASGPSNPKDAWLEAPPRDGSPCGVMARREERHDYELDIDYVGREAVRHGSSRPVTPDRLSVPEFADRLLWLKRKGDPKALFLLAYLQSSPFPRDQRVCERVMRAELKQPGIGKKLLGDPCLF
ncbi:papain-like cysteine protease family protein [Stigmatella sp. ncwal1]|uniref:Papain-like cysteine protease family protein n=1 Tax=Stigmatella ashevillensis TaxID=2995309 RepID=A0ABT5DBL2_9BACT|nr:papain-like cysteine protease family protein [Stigmatella ashevillena]MDC0711057.1 papain-like cysteine protease family protein [Stigmatella ashevillena]